MKKYKNSQYPDKANDFIDNDGRMVIPDVDHMDPITEDPMEDNPTDTLKVVSLSEEPAKRYEGYLYAIGLRYFPITVSITNGSTNAPASIKETAEVEFTITPNSGYLLPVNISVSGVEEFQYNLDTGKVTLSNPTENVSVTISCPSDFTPPTKGQIISMNLDGTSRNYRVLSVEGKIASVVAMFDSTTSQKFNASSKTIAFSDGTTAQQYMGSDLDTYLNETWYNTLNVDAKAAIVEVNRTQDLWGFDATGNPVFTRQNQGSDSGQVSKRTGTSPIGNRKVYALSVQEVFDYLELSSGDTMTSAMVWKMFWNDEVSHSGEYF